MAGIYIHIPFCKQKCHYCDFHFSTSLKLKNEMIDAIVHEIELRKDFFSSLPTADRPLRTIYFGGGTPSLLTSTDLEKIFSALHENFDLSQVEEITLEANPDDISKEKLLEWKSAGINRLSIGIQSFDDAELKYMNRAHDSKQAEQSIRDAQEAGFENISVDLIYGIPNLIPDPSPAGEGSGFSRTTDNGQRTTFLSNLEKANSFNIPHLSCYSLTVEPRTALDLMIKKGKSQPVSDEQSAHEFELLMEFAEANGYEHYEISNFARNEKYSKHNTAYWTGEYYLGIGPSAHSYNGNTRSWNVANNTQYIKSVLAPLSHGRGVRGEGKPANSTGGFEILTPSMRWNELVMISLRTKWGLALESLPENFHQQVDDFISQGFISKSGSKIFLTRKGKLIADRIISDLMMV